MSQSMAPLLIHILKVMELFTILAIALEKIFQLPTTLLRSLHCKQVSLLSKVLEIEDIDYSIRIILRLDKTSLIPILPDD